MKNTLSDLKFSRQTESGDGLPKYYKILAEMSQDIIFVVENTGTVKYINSFGSRIFKLPPKKLTGKNIKDLFPPAVSERMISNIRKAISTGRPLNYEGMIQYPYYSLWLDTQLIPIRDDSNRLNSVIGVSRDITEKKLSESMNLKYTSSLSNIIEILGQLSLEENLEAICQKAVLFAKKRLGFDRMEIYIADNKNRDRLAILCNIDSCKTNLSLKDRNYENIRKLLYDKGSMQVERTPVKCNKDKITETGWSISLPIRSKINSNIGVIRVISDFSGKGPDNYTISILRLYSMGLSYIIQNVYASTELRTSDELHKKILNAVDQSILVLTPELKIAFSNDYFSNVLNLLNLPPLKAGEHMLKKDPDHQKAFPNLQGYINKVIKTKKPYSSTERSVSGKNKTLFYNSKSIPILNRNKELELILNVSNNVTAEKTANDRLKQAESFLENVFNSIQDGISVLDKDLNIVKVNKVMEAWYKDSMPLVGKKCFEAYHFRDKNCVLCPTKRTLNTGKTCHDIHPKRNKAGKIIGWVELYSYPLKNQKTGKTDGVIEYVKDITKNKEAEEFLLNSEVKYKELWNNAPIAYHTLNPDGIITSVNETELKMLGYNLEDMLGQPIFNFIDPSQREEAQLRFLRKIAGKETAKSGNRTYIRNGGAKIFVSVDDVMEYNKNHEVISVRTTMMDVTRQRQIEDELNFSFSRLKKTMDDAMRVIARLVEMRDPYTAGHQVRVAQLACAIARELGLDGDSVERIRIAGLLHDIGKINVPIEILSKPGKISESELNIIKIHPSIGYEILKEMDFPSPVAETVLQHHERLDGKGYPNALKPKDIILEARILMVADVVEAMSSHRPYRPSKGIKEALAEIQKNKGKLYDSKVAKACLNVFKKTKFVFSER